MNENDLFTWGGSNPVLQEGTLNPATRTDDHESSIEAAASADRCAKGNRLLVLQLLRDRGPMTDFELADITKLQQNSIGKRRSECFQHGLVAKLTDFGIVEYRPAPSGAKAIVWTLTREGEEFLKKHAQ